MTGSESELGSLTPSPELIPLFYNGSSSRMTRETGGRGACNDGLLKTQLTSGTSHHVTSRVTFHPTLDILDYKNGEMILMPASLGWRGEP